MSVRLLHYLFIGLVSLIGTLILVPLVRSLAIKLDAVDYPTERRVNTVPTPRMGGLAMYGGMALAMAVDFAAVGIFGISSLLPDFFGLDVNYAVFFMGVTLMTVVGAIDDVKSLTPGVKFLGQLAAALIIALSGILLSEIKNPFGAGYIEFGILSYPITMFYLVAFANIINLCDGLDGLAAGISAISAIALFAIAFTKGRPEAAVFSIILLGGNLGFLRYNFAPASIFMGDSGSLLLGTMLGSISLLGVMRSPTIIMCVVPIIIAGMPVLDTFAAIVRRLRSHLPIQQADKDHLHHKLLKRGFSTRKSVLIVYAWTAFLALGAVLMSSSHGAVVYLVFALLLAVSAYILHKTGVFEPVLRHYYNPVSRDGGLPKSSETPSKGQR